jgi:Homeodomain-like domain
MVERVPRLTKKAARASKRVKRSFRKTTRREPTDPEHADLLRIDGRFTDTAWLVERATPEELRAYRERCADAAACKDVAEGARRSKAAKEQLRSAVEGRAAHARAEARRGGMAKTQTRRHPHVGTDADEENRATALHLHERHKWSERRIADGLCIHRNTLRRLLRMGGPVRSPGRMCPICKTTPNQTGP